MALSRFWAYIIVCSVVYIFYMLMVGRLYTIGSIVNGKQNDALVVAEFSSKDIQQKDTSLFNKITVASTVGYASNDTTYLLQDNGTVEAYYGKQSADGIFATCKNTIMDIWLPL